MWEILNNRRNKQPENYELQFLKNKTHDTCDKQFNNHNLLRFKKLSQSIRASTTKTMYFKVLTKSL